MNEFQRLGWRGWIVLLAIVAAVVGAMGWAVLARQSALAEAPRFEAAPVAVRTVSAQRGPLAPTRRYLAEVEGVREANLTARVTERVTRVAVDEGDRVEAGDTLVELAAGEVEARLDNIEAERRQVRAEREAQKAQRKALAASFKYRSRALKRVRSLYRSNSASQAEVDDAADRLAVTKGELAAARQQVEALTARLEALTARREELREQRADYTMTAPFDGTVTERLVDPGDQAAPGRSLIRVTSGPKRLAFGVARSTVPALAPGQRVEFRLGGEARTAPISRIHPSLGPARLARVEVDLDPDRAAMPGEEVEVAVALATQEDVAVIPFSALAGGGDSPVVYTVDAGQAQARAVTIRARSDERVAVAGIEPGTAVITTPYLGWTRLADGMPVEVQAP